MNILHFCPSQSFSGLEQYAFEMAVAQKNAGHHVFFVTYPKSTLEINCMTKGITTLSFNAERTAEIFKFWTAFQKATADKKLDVIHLHSTQEVPRFFQLKQLQNLCGKKLPKCILQIHLWINHNKKDPWHWLMYTAVDEVWCSSTPAKNALAATLPVKPEIIRIVSYGRDVENIEKNFLTRDQAREILQVPPDAVVMGCVSRIEKSKGVEELTRAATEVMSKNPRLHLVHVGDMSPNNSEAASYAAQNKEWIDSLLPELKARFHFVGQLNDSYKYLKGFDFYVLPSYEECFSLGLLDAQLAGLPCVGTNSGGTPEVVKEGETGFLCDPENTGMLQEAIEKMLAAQAKWNLMGNQAKDRVQKEFNQKNIFQDILKRYE